MTHTLMHAGQDLHRERQAQAEAKARTRRLAAEHRLARRAERLARRAERAKGRAEKAAALLAAATATSPRQAPVATQGTRP